MTISEKVNKPQIYNFSWDIDGYDCGPPKIRSPNFRVNIEATEWYIELDLSKLQHIESYIPFHLQRVSGIGPPDINLDVEVTVKYKENKCYKFECKYKGRSFKESGENFINFNISKHPRRLELNENLNWLQSKTLLIHLEMKSTTNNYWHTDASLKAVLNDLKTLHSTENDPIFHDLVLKIPGVEYRLHKCILNARWPKLASTLEINKPSKEVETKEFSDIPPALLEHLLNFAYYADLKFVHQNGDISGTIEIFDVVRKYNFYRLNEQISQLPNECKSSLLLQSFRTSVCMKFKNVTSTETAVNEFRTIKIGLKPSKLPKSNVPVEARQIEEFQHIGFMDLSLYVDKGPFGFNWLMFSVVLEKLPQENPVNFKCKLYVVDEGNANHFLTEQNFIFDRESTEISFQTPLSERKISKLYQKISEPIITWEELIDERKGFMQKRAVSKGPQKRKSTEIESPKTSSENPMFVTVTIPEHSDRFEKVKPPMEVKEKKDIFFRFELKLSDGESVYDMHHGQCIFAYKDDYKIFQDLELMSKDKFTDIYLDSGNRSVKVHKAIVAARSPKIFKLLKEEQTISNALPINIDPEYLHSFAHYLYTGQLPEVPSDKIDHLISVADEYEMKHLGDLLKVKKQELKLTETL